MKKYMNEHTTKMILLLIIFIAAVLRLYRLGEVPPSPDWDEASLGYNAYSIMKTGRDEYGEFLPFILRSFDDYKPALYTYVIIPFIALFDLNIFSVRLPSALFGILTVLTTYVLVRCLFSIGARAQPKSLSGIALLSAALLAISPWHIQFSRIAFESNVGLAFNVGVILFFLKGLKNPKFLLISFVLGAVNMYVYQSEKVFTPLLLLTLLVIFRSQVAILGKRWIVASFIVAFLISLPMVYLLVSNQQTLLRAKGVSIFSDQTQFLKRNAEKLLIDKRNGDVLGLFLDNRRFEYAKAIISGYISHFDLNWLFITGDLARHHAPSMGLLYIFEFPFLLLGIYFLLFGDFDKKIKLVVCSLFLLAPLPASVTSGVPHAVRTIHFLPILQIFTAIGIAVVVKNVSNMRLHVLHFRIKYLIFIQRKALLIQRKALLISYFLFLVLNFVYYLNQYFIQQNHLHSQEWQYGYQEAISFLRPRLNHYEKVVVSNVAPLDQSYIFFLFYLKYPPSLYQQEVRVSSGGFREEHVFGKFEFRPLRWNNELKKESILYIGRPGDFSDDARVLKRVYYMDGEEAIQIVEG